MSFFVRTPPEYSILALVCIIYYHDLCGDVLFHQTFTFFEVIGSPYIGGVAWIVKAVVVAVEILQAL